MAAPSAILRSILLAVSRSDRVKTVISTSPLSRDVVARYVAGESDTDAIQVSRDLIGIGCLVTLDYLGEDASGSHQAEINAQACQHMLTLLHGAGLTPTAELSIKLSALGLSIDKSLALRLAQEICKTADRVGATITIDMEDHRSVDATLATVRQLRPEYPTVGAVLQAALHRTESDCRELATSNSRVRLCKGAYSAPASVAYQKRSDIDRAYVRCLRILTEGEGYPMIATHDPRLISIAQYLVKESGRPKRSYEYQMLYGIRPDEQRRLNVVGEAVRVYVPYGVDWYGYLMRRLAERPANLLFFLRSIMSRR